MASSKSTSVGRRHSKKASLAGNVTCATPAPVRALSPARRSAPPILPGEDARVYRGRLKAWTGSLGPRNAVEAYLVKRAVVLSWQLDRADRVQLAHLTRIANLVEPDQAAADAVGRSDGLAFDDSATGERLRGYQLACGQALNRTLRAFSNVRGLADVAPRTRDAAPTAIAVAPPAGVDPSFRADRAMGADRGPVASAQDAAALIELLAPAGAEGTPLLPAVPMAAASSSLGRFEASHDEPDEGESRPGSTARRRPAGRRMRQAPWPGSGGPDTTGAAPIGVRSRPIRRAERSPEGTPNPPDTRRRVGGYAVPLEPTVTVSCADRIPVRLRRDVAAARLARTASCPSS
jgi:hypothetical protein